MASNPSWLVQIIDVDRLQFAFDGPSYVEVTEGILGPDVNAPDGMDENFNSSVDLVNAFQQEFDGSTFNMADVNSAAPAVDDTQIEAIQASAEANEQMSEQLVSDLVATLPADPTPVQLPVVPVNPPGGPPGGGGGPGDPGDGPGEPDQCPPGFVYVADPSGGPGSCEYDYFF